MINLRSASALMLATSLLCIPDRLTFADNSQALTSTSKPSQSSVASKGSFATLDAYSGLIKTATSAQDLKAATAFEGKQGTFTGTVTKVFAPSSNSIVVLDFDKDYDAAVTAVVKSDVFKAFPDLSKLNGKALVVTGPITEYHGRPQIVLTSPNQIQVITGNP